MELLTLDEFKKKMKEMEIQRHSKLIADKTMSGQDVSETDNKVHREMMETLNDDEKIHEIYKTYVYEYQSSNIKLF